MLNNRRIIVNKLTSDFRAATKIIEEKIPAPGKREMIIKNTSVGINASDVNFSSGAYLPGIQPPFNCGFEAVGTVVAAGPGAQLKEGDHCVYSDYGAFSEYHTGIGDSYKDLLMLDGNLQRLTLEVYDQFITAFQSKESLSFAIS